MVQRVRNLRQRLGLERTRNASAIQTPRCTKTPVVGWLEARRAVPRKRMAVFGSTASSNAPALDPVESKDALLHDDASWNRGGARLCLVDYKSSWRGSTSRAREINGRQFFIARNFRKETEQAVSLLGQIRPRLLRSRKALFRSASDGVLCFRAA